MSQRNRTSLSDPDLGGTQSFQMNSLGEVTQKTDAASHATAFTYDTLGRMRTESFSGASGENASWTYATSGNAAGRLTEATKANGFTRTLAYNGEGEPVTVTETYAGTPLTLHYGFDTLGRLASITYPATVSGNPLTVDYDYDSMGNLASVTNAHGGTVYWQSDWSAAVPAVNAWGEPQAWTLGNGIHVRRDHDLATGAVSSIIAGPGENSATQVSLAYGYGALGNATSAMDLQTDVTRDFAYTDGMNRLTQTIVHHAGIATAFDTSYDAVGHIATRTAVGTYSYGSPEFHAVRKITLNGVDTNYAYDGVGQMTSGASLSQIQWTRAGRAKQIVGAQTTSLAYGANGTLVQKTVAGTASRYFGRLIVKIGASYRARIVANGQVIALVNINAAGVATTDYLVHDAQGSPTALLDASGSLVARFAWNAWGELVNPATGYGSDPGATTKEALLTIGYTGHEELWNAGLVHTYARLYNPHIGLWLSPDPTVPHPFNGQSLNRYSYVLNNPSTLIDPLGLDGKTVVVEGCPAGEVQIGGGVDEYKDKVVFWTVCANLPTGSGGGWGRGGGIGGGGGGGAGTSQDKLEKEVHDRARCSLAHDAAQFLISQGMFAGTNADELTNGMAATIAGEVGGDVGNPGYRSTMIGIGWVFMNRFAAPSGPQSGSLENVESGFGGYSNTAGQAALKAFANLGSFTGSLGIIYSIAQGIVNGQLSALSGAENANFEKQKGKLGTFYPNTTPELATQQSNPTYATYFSCGQLSGT